VPCTRAGACACVARRDTRRSMLTRSREHGTRAPFTICETEPRRHLLTLRQSSSNGLSKLLAVEPALSFHAELVHPEIGNRRRIAPFRFGIEDKVDVPCEILISRQVDNLAERSSETAGAIPEMAGPSIGHYRFGLLGHFATVTGKPREPNHEHAQPVASNLVENLFLYHTGTDLAHRSPGRHKQDQSGVSGVLVEGRLQCRGILGKRG